MNRRCRTSCNLLDWRDDLAVVSQAIRCRSKSCAPMCRACRWNGWIIAKQRACITPNKSPTPAERCCIACTAAPARRPGCAPSSMSIRSSPPWGVRAIRAICAALRTRRRSTIKRCSGAMRICACTAARGLHTACCPGITSRRSAAAATILGATWCRRAAAATTPRRRAPRSRRACSCLAVPFTPTYAEYIFLKGRRVLADQMEYLVAHFPRSSPLHERMQRWPM